MIDMEAIRPLSQAQFEVEAKPPLLKLCGTDDPDPFGEPFLPSVERRVILYEYWYDPDGKLMNALALLASKRGDKGFYIAIPAYTKDEKGDIPPYWYVPFTHKDTYAQEIYRNYSVDIYHQNTIYSPQALWGIVSSYEEHGILGATEEFVEGLRKLVPGIEDQVFDFLEYWKIVRRENAEKYNLDLSWVPTLVKHVYGERKALKVLKQVGW